MTAYIRDLNHGADADVQTRVNTHWDQDGIVTRNRDADYLGFLWGHDDRDISTRIKPTRFQRRIVAVGRGMSTTDYRARIITDGDQSRMFH